MNNVRVITIPEDADEIYDEEYFKQLGIKSADKIIYNLKKRLNDEYGYDFEL